MGALLQHQDLSVLGITQIQEKDGFSPPHHHLFFPPFLLAEAQHSSIDFRCISKEGPDPKLTEVNQNLSVDLTGFGLVPK